MHHILHSIMENMRQTQNILLNDNSVSKGKQTKLNRILDMP